MRWIVLAIVLFSAAAEAKGKGLGEELLGSVTYADAGEKRRAWLDPKAIAEFSATAAGEKAIRALDPKATSTQKAGAAVRVWRLVSLDGGQAIAKLADSLPKQRFSRVYRDAPSTAGRARALTGNVVVTFEPKLATTAKKLLRAQSMDVVRTLKAPPATFVVRGPRGRDPLEAAEALAKTKGVKSASAEWWLEVAAR